MLENQKRSPVTMETYRTFARDHNYQEYDASLKFDILKHKVKIINSFSEMDSR